MVDFKVATLKSGVIMIRFRVATLRFRVRMLKFRVARGPWSEIESAIVP
jgi:hypothetical protein